MFISQLFFYYIIYFLSKHISFVQMVQQKGGTNVKISQSNWLGRSLIVPPQV